MIDLAKVCSKGHVAWRMVGFRKVAGRMIATLTIGVCSVAMAIAQQNASPANPDVPQPSTSLASQFFEHDFVNVFAFASGIYDTAIPQLTANSSAYGASFGFDVGGGVTGAHSFKGGTFSLSYRGDYRHYESSTYSNGANQSLSLLFAKRLSRRWTINTEVGGGVLTYGGQFYGTSPNVNSAVLTNPLSSQSRFANASISLTYQQTRRLSYTFSGQFFLSNYNYAGAVNSVGGSGTVSVDYRLTPRTTVGGTYSHSYFTYSGGLGTSVIDGGYLTVSHVFPSHWTASASFGETHSVSKGTITQPVSLLLGQQLVGGYITGPYNRSSNSPSFQVSVGRNLRHSLFSFGAGQGVNAGNGTYLTSKDQYANATYSHTRGSKNLSFGFTYTRLQSIANTVSQSYSSANASASYGFNVVRYVSANLRYDYIHYDNLYALSGVNESRFTFGLTFSSKSVPLTLF